MNRKADPFVRLRVPRYLKFFEAVFFISFLGLYYAVLVPIQRNGRIPKRPPSELAIEHQKKMISINHFHSISTAEILLYLWIAGFAYDECESKLTHRRQTSDLSTFSWRVHGCRTSFLYHGLLESVGSRHCRNWSSFLHN